MRELPVLGPMPIATGEPSVTRPILFLLERPGGMWKNGGPVKFGRFNKWPPVKHYYWTPECSEWPGTRSDVNKNFYGNYFAHLMRKHALRNVYITNLVKCRKQDGGIDNRIDTECFNRYLRRELKFFEPDIAFCFGHAAEKGLRIAMQRDANFKARIVYLYHPSARKNREELIKENDAWVKEALLRSQ
jgi:uracil-DNA glycosylase family 4